MMRNLKQFAGYNINQGFHIGVFISINNIWLSNKEFSCSENVSNIKPKFDFGKSYGLNIGYDYSDRWGIELEAQYAEQGQKYTETSVSNNTSKEVNLNYLKLPLMVKYKQSFINSYNSKPIVMSFLFGPQMGFLLKKEARVDGKSVACTQAYSKVETGLAAGIDFDLYMMRYMYLTIGARTGFGTSFKKGVPVSYQIGVTTQFNFRIPKKLK
jgi:opacity protein-like surface antigen